MEPQTAALHPLLTQLTTQHGFAELTVEDVDAFASGPGHALLLFVEDPIRFKETLDLAVIAPQLARAFAGVFRTAVLLPAAARTVAVRYGFRRWPAIVVLRDGGYVGAIDGLRNWDEYLAELGRLIEAPVGRPPTVGISVRSTREASGSCSA